MERGEPVLVPAWYKAANGGAISSANTNHHQVGSSAHPDEHRIGTSSGNKLLVSASDRDAPCSSAFADRSPPSSRGTSSANGSVTRDKDGSANSHPYSSFGRSRRDRDREKDLDLRGRDRVRDRSSLVENGFRDRSDSFKASSKDRLRRSQSMVSGRQIESWTKRPGNDSRNGVISGGSMISGIGKSSFERDFPSLGAEEKMRLPDRVSSPGLSTAVQSLPIASSAVIGGDGWTSALAEVPAVVGGNGLVPSTALHTPSTMTGLNMAEALAQAPSRVRTPPQLSVDTHRIEELTLRQCKQLIPVTPSMPKTSVLNSSDKSKSKGARGDLCGPPKVGQQSSSQLANHTLRAPRSDIPKISQAGNFQVLNRDRNTLSPTVKDVQSVRAVNPLSAVTPSAMPPLKSPLSPKLKADKGTALSSAQTYFGEKRTLSQAQNRNDFFNALRKKTSMNHSSATPEPSCAASAYSSDKLDEQSSGTCASLNQESNSSASNSPLDCSIASGNCVTGGCDTCEGPERFLPDNGENISCSEPVIELDEESVAFMRSLGWDENAGEDALTPEEIDEFFKSNEKLLSLKLSHRGFRPLMTDLPKQLVSSTAGGGSSGLSSSGCKAEA